MKRVRPAYISFPPTDEVLTCFGSASPMDAARKQQQLIFASAHTVVLMPVVGIFTPIIQTHHAV